MNKEQYLKFPLSFELPPSFATLDDMLDLLDYKIKSCTYKWILCFHGITSRPDETGLFFLFSLFFKKEYRKTKEIQSIELYVGDNSMNVIYPTKHYTREEVDCIIEMFIDFLNQAQQEIKAARHE